MSLVAALKDSSGGVLLRGILAVLVGLLALANPVGIVISLAMLFGIFAIIEGVLAVKAGGSASPREGTLILVGVLGVIVGLIGLLQPGLLALTIVTWIGIWAIVRGVLEIALALRLRKQIRGEGWMMLSGALSIAFGGLLIAQPVVGILAHGILFGIYCLVMGVALIALSRRLKALPSA